MSLHRPSRNPQGPGLLSGQHTPPIRAHPGTPGPSSCASLPSPAIGSLTNNLHLRMSSGAGMAAQSNMAVSPIHLPVLSPRRQLLTNGKPQFPVTQARGMAAPLTVKPKQQEFGDPFSPNPEKGRIVVLRSFKNGKSLSPLCLFTASEFYRKYVSFNIGVKVRSLMFGKGLSV